MTPAPLDAAEAALRDVRAAKRSLDRARDSFERAIREASSHASSRRIATEAGLSFQRVHQIVHGK